jgi:hypothetical protein
MPPHTYAPFVLHSFFSIADLLVQDFHHSRLLLCVLDQHAASAAHVFDDIHHFAEARGGATCLREAREAEAGAVTVFEDDEEFDDEGDGLDLQIYRGEQVSRTSPQC